MSRRYSLSGFILAFALILTACQAGQTVDPESPAVSTSTKPPTHTPTAQPSASPTSAPSPTTDPLPTDTPKSSDQPACFVIGFAPLAFMPDSRRIVVRGEAGVQIFSLEAMQEEEILVPPQNLNGPEEALSPDGEVLAWALSDFTVQLIRVADGELLHTLAGRTDIIGKLRFSTSADQLYSASHDTWVRVWSMDGEEVHAFQPTGADDFPSEVLGLGVSADGAWLASVPINGQVKMWDVTDYSLVKEIGGTGGFDTSDVAFSPDGQYIAADLATGLAFWRVSDQTRLLSGINSMAFAFSRRMGAIWRTPTLIVATLFS